MNREQFCDGCDYLDFTDAVNAYDVYAARCNDPEKPIYGKHRVVDISRIGKPFGILRPVWCRGKREKELTP